MGSSYKPSDEKQLADLVSWAAAEGQALDLTGTGTKRTLGCLVEGDATRVDLSALTGVVFYEPEELVMSVRPGTPLEDVERLLEEKGQMLAFEPPDWGWILGGSSAPGTIGGTVSIGGSGPRRFRAGAARDFVLGAHGVSGRGELFKSGGRVVKNVTGYDLHKLMTGAYGTLGLFTEITLKVLPAPEKTYTLLIFGLSADQAVKAMGDAARSPFEPSGLAFVPPSEAARSRVSYVHEAGVSVTAIRVEGPEVSVKHRMEELRTLLGDHGPVEELHSANSAQLWYEIRDAWLLPSEAEAVWRISVPPASGASVLEAAGADCCIMDWAGGLLWLGYDTADPQQGQRIRSAVGVNGHATLIRGSRAVREAQSVFQPQEAALARLTERLKHGFDPAGILNPGRMGPTPRGQAA
jgi:glycolate oxidase FAD binding subunit